MTLIIQKPTGAKLNLAQTYVGIDDPDAAVYVAAVEAADGEALETATKVAIHSFVKGCKADGIWPAIKASCILAGARTLAGALVPLVPLVGTAPTNNNFVSGDYNRKTGLVGNGSTKYLNSNRNNNADPQNSKHISVYGTSWGNANAGFIGSNGVSPGDSHLYAAAGTGTKITRLNSSGASTLSNTTITPSFMGASRDSSSGFNDRYNSITVFTSAASNTPRNANILVFQTQGNCNARLAFYSIGESLDLALLDARVTTLINAFAAAIP
jgi:hypothetical protein